jgi:hypothetical protein
VTDHDRVSELGCVAARQNHRAQAFAWLTQAADHGLKDADHVANDADLISLRGDPAFDALVARVRENEAAAR